MYDVLRHQEIMSVTCAPMVTDIVNIVQPNNIDPATDDVTDAQKDGSDSHRAGRVF